MFISYVALTKPVFFFFFTEMLSVLFNNLLFTLLFLQKGMLRYLVMFLTASEMVLSSGVNCKLLLAEGRTGFEVFCLNWRGAVCHWL